MSKITKGIEALNAGREALKKSLGFVSKVDEAAQALPRTKGTGAEFMKELEKQPGVKKAEIADRRLDKIKAMPKMTKEEFIKQIEEHPAPQLKEKVRSFDNEEEIERLAREKFLKENYYTGSLRQEGIQKWKSSNPLFKESYRQDIVNSEAGMALEPKYQDYTLPGGENYREVLIKLPVEKAKPEDVKRLQYINERLQELSPIIEKQPLGITPERKEYQSLLSEKDKIRKLIDIGEGYKSIHWEDPNVLAHVRVSDRWGPNDENVLHIEEIQSDWHQQAKKARDEKVKKLMAEKNISKKEASALVPENYGYQTGREEQDYIDYLNDLQGRVAKSIEKDFLESGVSPDRAVELSTKMATKIAEDPRKLANYLDESDKQMALHLARMEARDKLPDAPFKKNWHELVMKRMLNYAAENGYDKVVITPGTEQVSRYKLSNLIDEINVTSRTHAGTGEVTKSVALDTKDGKSLRFGVSADGTIDNVSNSTLSNFMGKSLDEVVGKDMAEKIMSGGTQTISGAGLEVGGEGMKGFYDKIIPDYLNSFGKQYGVQVGRMDVPNPLNQRGIEDLYDLLARRGISSEDYAALPQEQRVQLLQEAKDARINNLANLHSFDITPQMREDIKKGLPLYQAAPAIPAIPAAESLIPEQTEEGMKKGGSAEMKPTPRSKALGTAADFAKWLEESSKAQFGYKNPATEAISDFLGIPAVARTLEKASYGEPITNVGKANVPLIPDDTAEAAMTLAPAAIGAGKLATKGALALGRKGEKLAEQVVPGIMERGGLPAQALSDLATGSRSQIWIGPKAKTFDNRRLNEAVEMKKAGATDEEIWAKTGTYKGVDGVWRQEISDQQARFLTPEQRKEELEQVKEAVQTLKSKIAPTKQKDLFPKSLSEAKKEIKEDIEILKGDIKNRQRNPRTQGMQAGYMFEHPELYKAYPELLNLMITTEGRGLGSGTQASLSVIPRRGQLPGSMAMDIYDAGLRNNPTSSALHEMQHAVQTIEGMHPGGNPTMAFSDPRAHEMLQQERLKMLNGLPFEEFVRQGGYTDMVQAGKDYTKYTKDLQKGIDPAYDRMLQERVAMDYYKRLGGEAEARAVQERQMMGPSERRQNFPYSSYDILPEDIIVKPPREYKKGGRVKVSANQDTMFMDVADKKLKRK